MANTLFHTEEHFVSSSKTNCSFMLKQIVSIGKNTLFHQAKTDCFSLLEQTVSLYLNKVFISVN